MVYAPGTTDQDQKKQNRALQDHAGKIAALQADSAKMWVNFAGSTAVINDSLNVASVSRTSAGLYVITFTAGLASANYITMATVLGTNLVCGVTTQTASAVTVKSFNLSGTATDPTSMMVVCFG